MLIVRAKKEVRLEMSRIGICQSHSWYTPLVLCMGEIVEAERNPDGAVSAKFAGRRVLGLKPDEYEIIRDDAARDAEVESLRQALADCMTYVDCDNLTQQTKHRNWQAALDGKPFNFANVEVERQA